MNQALIEYTIALVAKAPMTTARLQENSVMAHRWLIGCLLSLNWDSVTHILNSDSVLG
jgi:hypothetical protein